MDHQSEDRRVIEKEILNYIGGSHETRRIKCPACSPERRDQTSRTLSVTFKDGYAVYMCHHCYATGRVNAGGSSKSKAKTKNIGDKKLSVATINIERIENPKAPVPTRVLDEDHVTWLEGRGIDKSTADKCGVVSGDVYLHKRGGDFPCIGFQYADDREISIKWRDGRKNFTQSGSCRSLWRIEEFTGGDLVICEGELDSLSYEMIGVYAASVPNGAPSKPSSDSSDTIKYDYLWKSRDKIINADRIIIATDSDRSGQILAEEIARRVGIGKCWRVNYPEGCKDANDVLVKHGQEELRSTLTKAMPWPIDGIRDASEFREKALDLYRNGMDHGVKVGIEDLDRVYTATPGTLTLFTGVPGNGKSSFLTFLSVELAKKAGWQSVILSAETPSEIHVLQLASLYSDKPFDGPDKMDEDELLKSLDWVQQHFTFIDDSDTDVDSVLERASVSVMRYGSRIIQIDPYNFLTLSDSAEENSSSINKMLVKLKNFSQQHSVCVWLVAHPTKMYRGQDGKTPAVGGYDVSGSASFFNVPDAGITIARDEPGTSKITNWKSRFPWIGSIGSTIMSFNPRIGSFSTAIPLGFGDSDVTKEVEEEGWEFDDDFLNFDE